MIKNIIPDSDEFAICDLSNPEHCDRLCEMVNSFITDPMGGGTALNDEQQQLLIKGLKSHPRSFVLFAIDNKNIIGFITVFINFSTFSAAPLMYIHAVFVEEAYRGKVWSVRMIDQITSIAKEKGCKKISLEVRKDNIRAQQVYKKLGFKESDTPMYYWVKKL